MAIGTVISQVAKHGVMLLHHIVMAISVVPLAFFEQECGSLSKDW